MTEVLKFYADWCGPCRIYAKVFEEVSEQLKDKAKFSNINIEKHQFKIDKEHTYLIGKNGPVIKRAGIRTIM